MIQIANCMMENENCSLVGVKSKWLVQLMWEEQKKKDNIYKIIVGDV